MTANEKIIKINEVIEITIAEMEHNNSSNIFERRSALRMLAYQPGNNLDPLFIDIIPTDLLGSFDGKLRSFCFNSMFGGEFSQTIELLRWVQEQLKRYKNNGSKRIFYSWQSDLANSTNRSLIQNAINDAIDKINKERSIELYMDQDTRGISGSPDIVNEILKKIHDSFIFICDTSAITKIEDKEIPNPNVLFELGYAINAISASNVLMIFNETSGNVKNLPFDLGLKRQIVFSCNENDQNKKEIKEKLVTKIKKAIETIIEDEK